MNSVRMVLACHTDTIYGDSVDQEAVPHLRLNGTSPYAQEAARPCVMECAPTPVGAGLSLRDHLPKTVTSI